MGCPSIQLFHRTGSQAFSHDLVCVPEAVFRRTAPLGRAYVVVEDGDDLGLGEGLHHSVQQVHGGAAYQLRVGREPLLPVL